MFRQLFRQNFGARCINSSIFKTARSVAIPAEKDAFLRAWAKMPESSRQLTAMTEENPRFAEVLLYKGHIYKARGFYEGAIEAYKEAAKLDNSYEEKVKYEVQEIEDFLQHRFVGIKR